MSAVSHPKELLVGWVHCLFAYVIKLKETSKPTSLKILARCVFFRMFIIFLRL